MLRRFCLWTAALLLSACSSGDGNARQLPFANLLAPPTAQEIRAADQWWSDRNPQPSDVRQVGITTISGPGAAYQVRAYTFSLNGSERCGFVMVPQDLRGSPAPAIVDLSDVRWDYPPRDLSPGPHLARILGEHAADFVIVTPCFRGATLKANELSITAGGDRADAWVGATEDAMAFVSAVVPLTPEIDSKRLAAYGYSRGGGVALLMGQRDPRIKAVLAFAAPTDWFGAMGRPGTDWPARLQDAQGDEELAPDSREAQFLDWFVAGRSALPLAELRQRLLAASPAYFAERLPPTQIHHGSADSPVPVANARAILRRSSNPEVAVHIYEGAGHMLDDTSAYATAREFLAKLFLR